jgi:N-methylhydantoinase B
VLRLEDGTRTRFGKATRLLVPKGATLELYTGGGGGYRDAGERGVQAVVDDLREGYISEQHARRFYPQAFPAEDAP